MNTTGNNDDPKLREVLKGNDPGMDFSDSVMKQVLTDIRNVRYKRKHENRVMLIYVALTLTLLLLLIAFVRPVTGFGSIPVAGLKAFIFNNPNLLMYGKIATGAFLLAFACLGIHLVRQRMPAG